LFLILADVGIQQYNNRQIAFDHQQIGRLFPTLVTAKILLAVPFFLIGWSGAILTGYIEDWRILIVIMINQLLVSFALFLRSNVSGLGMYRKDSILSVLDKVIMIIVCGVLLINPSTKSEFTILTFLYAQSGSFLVVCLSAWWILRRKNLFRGFHFETSRIWPLIKQTLPFGLAVFLMTLYTRIDGVMIERLLISGKYEASVYAGGYRLLDAANMLAFLFPPLLLPMFSKLQRQTEELRNLFRLSFSLMWTLVVIAGISCFTFRQEIMDLLYLHSDRYWGRVFGILILNFIWIGLIHVFGTFVTATGKMKSANWVFFSCIILNVLLNYLLIPDFKAWGAAMTTLATHGTVVIGLCLIIRKQILHDQFVQILLKGIVLLGIVILINWGIYAIPGMHWIIRFIFCILTCLILTFSIRFLDLKELKVSFIQTSEGQ
jgi:O-antigen/teichoic acid export membrane protein